MKKMLAAVAALVFVCISFAGAALAQDVKAEKLSVVATNFPAFDFARQVAGDSADVTMLLPPGAESHTYEPTPQDILKIQDCDLFIYVGGESDTWVDNILSSFEPKVNALRMIDCVAAVEEVTAPGMQAEEDEDEADSTAVELDEHVWTAPANAIQIAQGIAKELETLDPANASAYQANTEAYTGKLAALDQQYKDFFAGACHEGG